jgi:Phage tail tube protein
MPASKAEQVLDALKALLETVPDAVVERNSVLPEKIPDGGLIVVRDGDPGEPELALGGLGSTYYQHVVEVKLYVEEGDAGRARQCLRCSPAADRGHPRNRPTLGGLAFGLTYGRPEPSIEASRGRTGHQERDALGNRRLRDRRTSRLTLGSSPRAGSLSLDQETTMARAYGSSAHLLMKRETTYGQAATGNYIRMPFNRCNLGSEEGLIDDPVLGQGRDPLAPLQDVIIDEGDIVVPVDPRHLGLGLTGLFGDPDTTDNLDGSWDHEFGSGGDDLPSYTLEVGMPRVPAFFVHVGVKLNSIALEFTRSGPAAATISAIPQGETRFGTTQGGTPTSLTFSRISQFQGSIKRVGSPVGNLTGGSVTYSNNLEKIETIRDDGLIEGADPTIAALTGRIDVRSAETTLIDLAAGGKPVDLEFAYTLSAQAKLVLTAHEVYLPKPKLAVEGPGGVQAGFDFRGAKNDVAGRMLTVTLTNDLDGTVYG